MNGLINKELIMKAWVFLREKEMSIPNETLDFMRDAALEKLSLNEPDKLSIPDVLPILHNVHKLLEVDFDEQTNKAKEAMIDIVEMCKNIAEDYWMYRRD